ncbi:MAG: DUF3618 domain-containing protein [Sporichthyaceae bacterium]|nr:DUF3618 domain-containing protein [Sporichthyaceae bacterium]
MTTDKTIPTDPLELQREIHATRAELGDTVAELAAKADVKARAREGVTAVADRAKDTAKQVNESVRRRPAPLAVGAVAALLAIGVARLIQARTAKSRKHSRWPWSR